MTTKLYPVFAATTAATIPWMLIGEILGVILVCFLVLTLISSLLRFEMLTDDTLSSADTREYDPLCLDMVKRLGTGYRLPNPFVLLLLRPEKVHDAEFQETVSGCLESIRGELRQGDGIYLREDGSLGIVCAAERSAAERLAQRVLQVVHRNCAVRHLQLYAGAATSPENGSGITDLLAAADKALQETTQQNRAVLADNEHGNEYTSEDDQPLADSRLNDELTGLLLTDRIPVAVKKYVAGFRRRHQPVSFLYIDVDRLERYNRQYGRQTGDEILKNVAAVLQRDIREDDLLARHEDDEFVIIMAAPLKGGLKAARRLSQAVKQEVTASEVRLKATVSIGIAAYPDHGSRPEELLQAAATAMETAAAKGSGICQSYQTDLQPVERRDQAERIY